MGVKSILCILSGLKTELSAISTALLLGKAAGAHIRFLHIAPDPVVYAAMYGYGDCYSVSALLEACEKENQECLNRSKEYVTSLAEKSHIPLEPKEYTINQPSACFVHLAGYPDALINQEGRLSDLIILSCSKSTEFYNSIIIAALFNTGRPVLLLPAKEPKTPAQFKTIAVAWKGTLEAARAIYNALPFLEKAEKVYVLTAEGPGEDYNSNAGVALMEYFRVHGIKAQCIVVAAGNRTPAEALLIRAKDLKTDLLVMGAYGHTRFRETLLGGVTNHMLKEADIPLLLSH